MLRRGGALAIARNLALAGSVFLAVILVWDASHSRGGVSAAVEAGHEPAAPDFNLRSLEKSSERVRLDAYAGHLVVLAFWASWCGPCKAELPELERLWRGYRGGPVVFVAIDAHDSLGDARAFVRRHKLTMPTLGDPDDQAVGAYGVQSLPEMFIISPAGRVVEHFRGIVSTQTVRAAIEAHT